MNTTSTLMSPLSANTWHETLSKTDGRDKLFRLAQYACKLVRGLDVARDTPAARSATLAAVEMVLGSGRQTFRLFKWASVYVRLRTTGLGAVGDAALFGYYLMDNVALLVKMGVLKGDAKRATRRAAHFWLVACLVGLVGGVRRVVEMGKEAARLKREVEEEKEKEDGGEKRRLYEEMLRRRRTTLMVCGKNLGDVVVAGSLSKETPLHPVVVGSCGVLSSLIGFWQVWPRYMPTG